jgi:uncharacterized membrane protein
VVVGQGGALLLEEQAAPAAPRPVWHLLASPWPALVLLVAGLLVGFPLLALAGLGVAACYRALRWNGSPAEGFVLLVVALGSAICFGTELIYFRDVFEGSSARMNTVFKFYYQVWLLWGSTSAFALWWLLVGWRVPSALSAARPRIYRIATALAAGLFALLLVGALVYPLLNLRTLTRDATWVGLEGITPRERTEAGRAAIEWLREQTPPDSVVLEMVGPGGGSYNNEGYAGVAASSGRATVLGWFGHEVQWRGGDEAARAELSPRQTDVDTIYSTDNPELARDLLSKYGVDYVYIGQLERQSYTPESLAKFDQIGHVVFREGTTTIYEVSGETGS